MKKSTLSKEEKKILQDFESGKLKRVKSARKDEMRYEDYAEYTLRKSKSINIRLPEKDLLQLKAIAAAKGLPYQTLISSLLHQYSADKGASTPQL